MKTILKENKILIIIYVIMFIIISLGVFEYQNEYGYKKRIEAKNYLITMCKEQEKQDNYVESNFCSNVQNMEIKMDDTITTFFNILFTKSLYYLCIIMPLFIIICSINKWHKYIKNGVIKNFLMRQKYSELIKTQFLKCYKQILLFLGFILLIFIISFFISHHFDYSNALMNGGLVERDFYTNMPYSFILFLIVLALNYALYINIALISCRFNKNYYVCILVSYLTWMAIDIIIEIFIGGVILTSLFKIKSSVRQVFNLLALYTSWSNKEALIQLFLSLFLVLISFLIVYIVYRKKEKVVIASEK